MTDPFAVDPDNREEVLAAELARLPFDLIDRLVALRHQRKLKQVDVARLMNRHESQVSRFEKETDDPRLSTVVRYAYAIGARIHVEAELADVHGYPMPGDPQNVYLLEQTDDLTTSAQWTDQFDAHIKPEGDGWTARYSMQTPFERVMSGTGGA